MDSAQSLSLLTLLLLAAQGLSKGHRTDRSPDYREDYYDSTYEPPSFQARSQSFTVEVGQSVIIPCDVENPTGVHKLIIKKFPATGGSEKLISVGGDRVIPDRRITIKDDRLTIINAKPRDAGTFLCQFDLEPPLQLRHTLDVQYSPTVKALAPKEVLATKGETVTLSCQALGNPRPIVRWSRQKGPLPSGQSSQEGESVVLEKVDRRHEGTYLCTADNGIGKPASDSISLTVEYAPEIIVNKPVVHTGEGGQVELECEVLGRPTPEVFWSRSGHRLTPTTYHGAHLNPPGHWNFVHTAHDAHLSRSRHTLSITSVRRGDFGDYVCTAVNDHGNKSAVVQVTGQPKAPRISSSPNGGESNRYTLTWNTETHSPITEFQIKYRRTHQGPGQSAYAFDYPGLWRYVTRPVAVSAEVSLADPRGTTRQPQHLAYTLEDLEVATDYVVVVRVRNKYDWSEDSLPFNFSTKKAMAVLRSTSGSSGRPSLFCLSFLVAISALVFAAT